jgi:hypothetical protein
VIRRRAWGAIRFARIADQPSIPVVEVEALERVREVGLGDAWAVVHDLEAPGAGQDLHRAAGRRRPERVLDEVRERLQDAVRVADRDRVRLGEDTEPEPERPRRGLVTLARGLGQAAEVERLGGHGERPAPEPGEV